MALKLKIEKLEDVEEAQRALYVEDKEGGGFILAVDGLEDTGALKRAKDHEAAARKTAEAELKKLQDAAKASAEAARKAAEEAAAKDGNIEALRKSAEERLTNAVAERDAHFTPLVQSLEADVHRLLIENVAQSLASELAIEGSAGVLIPHISARLGVEVRDGKRVTVIKGPDGKPSTLSVDDLKKEISGNKGFAPVIVGSKGSGSGANGAKGGGATGAKTIKRSEFDKLSPAERQAKLKPGPDRVTVTD